MSKLKTMEELERFSEILSNGKLSREDDEYARFFTLKLAGSLIYDLGDTIAAELANIILAAAQRSHEVNKDPYIV